MSTMKTSTRSIYCGLMLICTGLWSIQANAGMEAFHSGSVIKEYGKVAKVNATMPIPNNMEFKVVFDMSEQAKPGALNRHLVKLARFINMHVEAGVSIENIHLATVIHGKAINDVANQDFYQKMNPDIASANIKLVEMLVERGVKFYICGQSAVYYEMNNKDIVVGVDMALSAMTAHAILAKQGFSLNPF